MYTYSESLFFSPSGALRISPEKSTVRPERTFTDAYFSFFLFLSPSFAPIRKNGFLFPVRCPLSEGISPACELLFHNIHSPRFRSIPGKAPYFPAFPACLFLSLRFIHSYSHFPVYISGGQQENFPDFRRFSPIVKTLKNLLVNNCEQTCELPCFLSISVPLFRRNLSSAAGKKRETRADCSGFPVFSYLLYIFTLYNSDLLPDYLLSFGASSPTG